MQDLGEGIGLFRSYTLTSEGSDWNTTTEVDTTTITKLYTGSRGIPGARAIFRVSANVAGLYLDDGGVFPTNPLDPATHGITIGGKSLGTDGYTYFYLPDNVEVDMTPNLEGYVGYSYSVGASKHEPVLGLNLNVINNPSIVTPEVCVGQKAKFAFGLQPSLPMFVSQPKWAFSGDYVNEVLPNAVTGGSPDYHINYSLLLQLSPFCWYLNGGEKTAKFKGKITFSNGQTIDVNENGKFNSYEPTLKFSVTSGPRANVYDDPNDSLDDGYVMTSFEVKFGIKVLSKYNAKADWTQLIRRQSHIVGPSPLPNHNFSDYLLDTAPWYQSGLITGTTTPVAALGYGIYQNMLSGDLVLKDSPQLKPTASHSFINDSFISYFRFLPSVGNDIDNIPVVLYKVTWGWGLTADSAPGTPPFIISGAHNDDIVGQPFHEFPFWTKVYRPGGANTD